jgi:hypothetical protein
MCEEATQVLGVRLPLSVWESIPEPRGVWAREAIKTIIEQEKNEAKEKRS